VSLWVEGVVIDAVEAEEGLERESVGILSECFKAEDACAVVSVWEVGTLGEIVATLD